MTDAPLPAELAVDEEPFPVEAVDRLAEHEGALHDVPGFHDVFTAHRWQIEDHGAAEWALRRLAEARANIAALEEQAAAWNRRIDEWTAKALAPLLNREQFFVANLEDYGLRVREASADEVKTLVLPSGKVKTTSHGPKVKVGDPHGFDEWAAANPDDELVRTTYDLAAGAVKGRVLVQAKDAGASWQAWMECGHMVAGTVLGIDMSLLPAEGDELECDACADPIAGAPDRKVVGVDVKTVHELVARDATTGEAIAWASVEPGGVSVTVTVS